MLAAFSRMTKAVKASKRGCVTSGAHRIQKVDAKVLRQPKAWNFGADVALGKKNGE